MSPESPHIVAQRVKEDMRVGNLDAAYRNLQKLKAILPTDATIFFTSARIARKLGNIRSAENDFRKSVELGNSDPSALAQYASLLAEIDKPHQSVKFYDAALKITPNLLDAEVDKYLVIARQINPNEGIEKLNIFAIANPLHLRAWSNLAIILREELRISESENAISHILSVDQNNSRALQLKAQIHYDRGEISSPLFFKAREENTYNLDVILGEASALLQEDQPNRAIDLLQSQLQKQPLWKEGHSSLSQVRWQLTGDDSFTDNYKKAVEANPEAAHLWTDYIIATSRALGYEKSLDLIDRARAKVSNPSFLDGLAANSLAELRRFDEAEEIFQNYEDSDDFNIQLPYLRHLCLSHQFDRAQKKGLALAQSGFGAHTWPYVSMAWRMLNDKRWEWLEGDPRLVKVTDVEPVQPLLEELTSQIRAMHNFKVAPFNQSLRDGTQSDGTLFYKQFPVILKFVDLMRQEIQSYLNNLPPIDKTHPLLSLNRDHFKFNGSWSVRLTSSGFHVNHIHSEGSLSSAFYVSLPDTLGTGTDGNEDGWLAVGEPAKEFNTGLRPLRMVQPKRGRLVLFPSTMWHGTRPFDDGERLTIAFDTLLKR